MIKINHLFVNFKLKSSKLHLHIINFVFFFFVNFYEIGMSFIKYILLNRYVHVNHDRNFIFIV